MLFRSLSTTATATASPRHFLVDTKDRIRYPPEPQLAFREHPWGSQPWAWRESGVGVVDPKDGGSVDRQQQLHDGSVLQDFSQAHSDDDDGMQVDRDYGHGHEGDENDYIEGEAGSRQIEIHNSKNPTNPSSTTVVAAHSGLYYNKSNKQDTPPSVPITMKIQTAATRRVGWLGSRKTWDNTKDTSTVTPLSSITINSSNNGSSNRATTHIAINIKILRG